MTSIDRTVRSGVDIARPKRKIKLTEPFGQDLPVRQGQTGMATRPWHPQIAGPSRRRRAEPRPRAPSASRSSTAPAASFFAAGFDAASMGEIAREAKVSKGTLYVYFDSKEALFAALIEETKRATAERLVGARPRQPRRRAGADRPRRRPDPEARRPRPCRDGSHGDRRRREVPRPRPDLLRGRPRPRPPPPRPPTSRRSRPAAASASPTPRSPPGSSSACAATRSPSTWCSPARRPPAPPRDPRLRRVRGRDLPRRLRRARRLTAARESPGSGPADDVDPCGIVDSKRRPPHVLAEAMGFADNRRRGDDFFQSG